MRTIAFLTDFGLKDNFVGVIKGVILTINSGVQLVDITHQIPKHSITSAAFLLSKSYSYFPKGTIFLVVVDPGVGSQRRPLAIKTKDYYFIGPDNGSLSIAALDAQIERIVALENKKYFRTPVSSTFHGRDIFAPVAAYLSKNISFSSLGRRIKNIKKINLSQAVIKGNVLEAKIIYIDQFGNLVTNVTGRRFRRFLKGKNFVATLKKRMIKKICSSYEEEKQYPFLIEAGFGYLEISLRKRSAKDYFGLKDIDGSKLVIKRVLR